MKKTKCTGQTCVGDVRLAPLDVGFDVKDLNIPVEIPADATSVGYDRDGQTWLVEGTREEIVAELTSAGYRIAPGEAE